MCVRSCLRQIMQSVSQFGLVISALGFGLSQASAQYILPAPAARAPSAYEWNGLYVGGKFGYGSARKDGSSATLLTGAFLGSAIAYDVTGGFGGLRTGYNFLLTRQLLLGLETDISFGNLRGEGLNTSNNSQSAKIDWFATARGRVGYVFNDKFLVYGTGGAAWVHIYDSLTHLPGGGGPAPVGTVETSTGARFGWTAGGGIEMAINRNWAVTIEYLYMAMKYDNIRPVSLLIGHTELTFQTMSVGVNYKF